MGRGRVKGKKPVVTNQDDVEEENVAPPKRRGRPQKSLRDEMDDEEAQKTEDEGSEDMSSLSNNDAKSKAIVSGKKRMRNSQDKEKVVDEEINGNGARSSVTEELNQSNGFRQNGNRRKSKPRRAAEAVVECN